MDLHNLFFVVDEYMDVLPAHVVRDTINICIDALHDTTKARPDGENILGEMMRQ